MREIDPHLPIDKTAAFVVSKSNKQGLDFKCGDKIYSMTPLPTRQFPGLKEHDLTGRKCGAFRVIGCSLWVPRNYLTSRANTIRWVVKCKCGRYAILTTKAVKKNHPDTACDECKKFIRPDGSKGNQPSTGTTLFGYGDKAVDTLKNAEKNGLGILMIKN